MVSEKTCLIHTNRLEVMNSKERGQFKKQTTNKRRQVTLSVVLYQFGVK